jgi:hypothetical protein
LMVPNDHKNLKILSTLSEQQDGCGWLWSWCWFIC